MDESEAELPPNKKIKLDGEQDQLLKNGTEISQPGADLQSLYIKEEEKQRQKEIAAGIEEFVSSDPGFQGILKRRYHDFLVNEIMPDGKVARLDDPTMLKAPSVADYGSTVSKKTNGTTTTQSKKAQHKNTTVKALDGTATNDTEQRELLSASNAPTAADTVEQAAAQDVKSKADESVHVGFEESTEIPKLDTEPLKNYFDTDAIEKLATIFKNVLSAPHKDIKLHGTARSRTIDDKGERTKAHQAIREAFQGRIESETTDDNILQCSAAATSRSRKGGHIDRRKVAGYQPQEWDKLGGDYLHFSLYKENRDAGDVLGFVGLKLQIRNQKAFDIAGNKDRRAVTVQRISAYRIKADRLLAWNNGIKQAKIGDCSYQKHRLQLGHLAGNEFVITLRDCAVRTADLKSTTIMPEEISTSVRQGMESLHEKGFINYFGLQRFGSFATKTDEVGQEMLKGDYEAVVNKIIDFSPDALKASEDLSNMTVSIEDKRRAKALNWFAELGDAKPTQADIKKILDEMPKRFSAEFSIVQCLLKQRASGKQPYHRGAIEAIPRTSRSLYAHAYQSLIWNLAASQRWRLSPQKLMVGDLVLGRREEKFLAPPKVDAQGEPIFEPTSVEPSDSTREQLEGKETFALTEEDIASGKYSIFDVVLPQPGHDVKYPSFMLGFYKDAMMKHGGLDPENMRSNWREANLPGAYRKLLGRPSADWGFEQVWYDDPEAQIARTDWERLEAKQKDEEQAAELSPSRIDVMRSIPKGNRLAIVLKFQLGSSTYATMALRELMKPGPVEFKPDFSSGRGL